MLLSFTPLKNIILETRAQAKHIRARANRMGLRKHYILSLIHISEPTRPY